MQTSQTSLNSFKNEHHKAAAAIAAAFFAVNVATAAPAFAAMHDFAGSSQIVAGRSGGRAGGRSGGGGARARSSSVRSSSSYSSAPRTTYNSQTTIVRPMMARPSVVISPFGGGYGGYGYNPSPFGGLGLGYGLGAMNNRNDEARDYRQEAEIQKERAELDVAKEKNAALEARIQALEQTGKPLQVVR